MVMGIGIGIGMVKGLPGVSAARRWTLHRQGRQAVRSPGIATWRMAPFRNGAVRKASA